MKILSNKLIFLLAVTCPVSFAAEQDITSNTPDRWQFTEDTVANIKADLNYEGITLEDGNTASSPLGAIFNSTGALTITSANEAEKHSILIDDITKNTTGALFNAQGDLIFDSLGDLTFSNYTTAGGTRAALAAYSANGDIFFRNIGDILFENNKSASVSANKVINAYNGSVSFEDTGSITMRGTYLGTSAGTPKALIYSNDRNPAGYGVTFRNTGAVAFEDNGGQVVQSLTGVLFSGVEKLTFRNNVGAQDGGALYTSFFDGDDFGIVIVQSGDVIFEGNKAGVRGGAIEIQVNSTANTNRSILLSADQGDIVFKGNLQETDTTLGYSNPVANAVYVTGNNYYKPTVYGILELRAQEGREASFYDPIISNQFGTGMTDQTGVTTIDLNKASDSSDHINAEYGGNAPSEFKGTVRFSGKETANYIVRNQVSSETASAYQARLERSRYSDIIANTTLHDGTLIVEHDAVFGHKDLTNLNSKGMRSSLNVTKGTLDMNNRGVINACDVAFAGQQAVIRTDGTSTINALSANLGNGISVDLQYYIASDTVSSGNGLTINADAFTMGGMLAINDSAAGFYADEVWSQDQTFTLFTLNKSSGGSFGSFDGIVSSATGTTVIDSLDGYQGYWTFNETVSGNKQTITATWTVTAAPIPEPASGVLLLMGAAVFASRRRR